MWKFRIRHLLIRYLLPIVWRFSPARKIQALIEFSLTETDSGWQSLNAFHKTQNTYARAALFNHALEEFQHAYLFRHLAQKKSPQILPTPYFPRISIWKNTLDQDAALIDFFAYLQVGEREINLDFDVYAEVIEDPDVKRLFQRIKEDEDGHESEAEEKLQSLAQTQGTDLKALKRSYLLKLAYGHYVKYVRIVGEWNLQILLSILYYLFAPFLSKKAKSRMLLDRRRQLEIAQKQIEMAQKI